VRVRRGLPSKTPRRESAPLHISARPTTAASAASAAATLCCPSPQYPMTTAAKGEPPPSLLLGPVLGTLPADLFQQEVMRRLGPTDLASLARAGRGCAAAVAATARMRWAGREKSATATGHLGNYLPPLCLKEACSHAALGGNREVLEWLHNTGCPWDATTVCAAAAGGHQEALKWMHNHGYPWNHMTCAYAARSGHLRVLQWAHEHHCPWDWVTPANAASGGHLEVLQWARQHDRTARGTGKLALTPLRAGTWRYCSGCGRTTQPARLGTSASCVPAPLGPGSRRCWRGWLS